MDLSGKIAIITGGASGIGKGCAVALAKAGADIYINDRPESPDLSDTVKEIEKLGNRCQGIEANIFTREGCEQILSAVLEAAGRVDILVSNPAYSQRYAFLDCPPELFEKTIQATLTSGFHMSQLVARQMVKQGDGGKIVFISSIHAVIPIAPCVSYNSAKAGLNHMAKSIAAELFQHRINVNMIEPGWIDTPGERKAFTEEEIRKHGATLPWGRLGTPEDIGNAACFLCSEKADYITGTPLRVDGGFILKDCVQEFKD